MWDYQRMVSQKLTNTVLKSILWKKVAIEQSAKRVEGDNRWLSGTKIVKG